MEDKKISFYFKNGNCSSAYFTSYKNLAIDLINKDAILINDKTIEKSGIIYNIDEKKNPDFLETLKKHIEYNRDYITVFCDYKDYFILSDSVKFIPFNKLEETLKVFVGYFKKNVGPNNNIYDYYTIGLGSFGFGLYNKYNKTYYGIFSSFL